MAVGLLCRYNYMKIWGMSKGSCLFLFVSVIVGEKALLSVLRYVQPRPDMRVRRDPVSGAYHSSCAFSVMGDAWTPSVRGTKSSM